LYRAVAAGNFRRDLYYRLNVAPLDLLPLRRRRGDILPLVHHFIEVYGRKLGQHRVTLSRAAEAALVVYDWPGNIRELENVVHFALIMCSHHVIETTDLRFPDRSMDAEHETPAASLATALRHLLSSPEPEVYAHVERCLVIQAFELCAGNQVRTAKRLGISRNILRAHLKRFGLLGSDRDDLSAADDTGNVVEFGA
jgi:sigma-54-specific transcriptional regulator